MTENGRSVNTAFILSTLLRSYALEQQNACWTGYFARFHTISNVNPADVRGFVNFISSAVMDVMIRR